MSPLVTFPVGIADRIEWPAEQNDRIEAVRRYIREGGLRPGDAFIIEAVSEAVGLVPWGELRMSPDGRVAAEWARSAAVTDQMLADTFGPQFREVVALIRRSAVITEQEAAAMVGVLDWDARRMAKEGIGHAVHEADPARHRMAFAGGETAWAAAWDAVRDVEGGEDRVAVLDATVAVSVIDLVGRLNQEHIDTLLTPVREVLGDPLDERTVEEWLEIGATPLVRFPVEVADRITETSWTTGWGDRESFTCLHGHVRMCDLRPGDEHIIAEVFGSGPGSMGWNDQQTSHEPVAEWARSAAVTDQMLADTFGPEFRRVVALVRRSAVITEHEARHLAAAGTAAGTAAWHAARHAAWRAVGNAAWRAAWDAVGNAAWRAAWDAAGNAARNAARNAAQDAGDAAWHAAWTAAQDAASAIVVADLVGQSGLTQEHIDILLHPVRAVLGDPLDDNTVAEWLEIR